MSTQQTEALQCAADLEYSIARHGMQDAFTLNAYRAMKMVRTQQARITELEAQLEAIGAGGVSPLIAVAAGWQPIETAPQDGDVLLCSSITKRKPIIDRWHDYCRVNHPQFTHWQPLPAAPSIAGETK